MAHFFQCSYFKIRTFLHSGLDAIVIVTFSQKRDVVLRYQNYDKNVKSNNENHSTFCGYFILRFENFQSTSQRYIVAVY